MLRTFLTVSFAALFTLHSEGASVENHFSKSDTLPFYEIPEAPNMFTAANAIARMVDGLGFRYYWATEGLREEDLTYQPGNEGQTCEEVLAHILSLSRFIVRTVKEEVHDSNRKYPDLTWEGQREETLKNLDEASKLLRNTGDVSALEIVFKRGDKTSEFSIWYLLNGPLADAIYHTGQIVSFRRSSGNPINPNISVFSGTVRN